MTVHANPQSHKRPADRRLHGPERITGTFGYFSVRQTIHKSHHDKLATTFLNSFQALAQHLFVTCGYPLF